MKKSILANGIRRTQGQGFAKLYFPVFFFKQLSLVFQKQLRKAM